jgi:hypothetical protein
LLLLKERTIKRIGGRIIEKFKAIENLNSATFLNTDDTAIDTWRWKRRNDTVTAIVDSVVMRSMARVHLRLNPSVMIGDVNDDEWV